MNFYPHCLVSVALFGLQVGLVAATEPTTNLVPAQQMGAPPAAMASSGLLNSNGISTDDPAQRSGIIGGVGLYLIQPYFERNLAYTVEKENQQHVNPAFHVIDRVDISQHVEPSPLLWLGYMDDSGLGGRARYWYFREGTSQSATLPAATAATLGTIFSANPLGLEAFGDTFFAPDRTPPVPPVFEPTAIVVTSKLEVQVIDLECMQDVRSGCWDLLFSGGVRLARVAQAYNFYDLQPTAVPLVQRSLVSTYNFDGVGPVLAVEVRRLLGDSGLALYTNGRGSVLFGRAQQDATFGGTILRNEDANPQFATERRNRAIPTAELELGLEYGHEVCGAWLFGQIGLVGQEWLGAGNASRSAQTSFREGAPIGGTPDDSDIGFFGLACRLGLAY